MTSDVHSNLPAVPEAETVRVLEMPVAEFEGEMVRLMLGKLPGIILEMDYGYARGTHLKLELEVRVRSVRVDEVNTGKNKGDLYREHQFAIEEARIVGAYTADETDPGIGGGLAATGADIEDEGDLEMEMDGSPERTEEDERGSEEDAGRGRGIDRGIDPGF